MTGKDGPTRRILHVLDLLRCNGPMTLAEVAGKCSFSRAAVWRALDTLREMGWVRMRLGDHAFVMLAEKTLRPPGLAADFPDALRWATEMQRMERAHNAHVSIGGFIGGARFRILESTERGDYAAADVSLVHDGIALAAQAALKKVDLVRILRSHVAHCPLDERQIIEDGRHAERLQIIARRGYYLSPEGTELAFPLEMDGAALALRVRAKSESPLAARPLISWLKQRPKG